MRPGTYSYLEVSPSSPAVCGKCELECGDDPPGYTMDDEDGTQYLFTFSGAFLKSTSCVFVHVDEQFVCNASVEPSLAAQEMRAHCDLYLYENPRSGVLLNLSVAGLGERLGNAPAAELATALHRWILKPIIARAASLKLPMGWRSAYPFAAAPPQSGHISNCLNSGGPTFFAGWSLGQAYPTVAFLSDWHDVITTPVGFQQALLAIGRAATDCLLAHPEAGSFGAPVCGGSVLPHAGSKLLRPGYALPLGLPQFCCILICTRRFVQFGTVHRKSELPQSLRIVPLSSRLSWESAKDRRVMAELGIGIACWLKRNCG